MTIDQILNQMIKQTLHNEKTKWIQTSQHLSYQELENLAWQEINKVDALIEVQMWNESNSTTFVEQR